jgi:hypothetical protein
MAQVAADCVALSKLMKIAEEFNVAVFITNQGIAEENELVINTQVSCC